MTFLLFSPFRFISKFQRPRVDAASTGFLNTLVVGVSGVTILALIDTTRRIFISLFFITFQIRATKLGQPSSVFVERMYVMSNQSMSDQ
jgi:hypothetical protein